MSRLLFLPPIQLMKLFIVITSFLRCAAKQRGDQSTLFNLELCCTCCFTGEHNYLLHSLLHLRSGICELIKSHILAEIIIIVIFENYTLVRALDRLTRDDRSPMVDHHKFFHLGGRSIAVIAVADIVGVKPLGERLAINPQASKQRVVTENFKSLIVCFVSVYRFYFSSPLKNYITDFFAYRLNNRN